MWNRPANPANAPNYYKDQLINFKVQNEKLDTGFHDSISVNYNGTIAEAHEADGKKGMYYRLGHLKAPGSGDFSIVWDSGDGGQPWDDGVNPQLAGVANDFLGDISNDFLAVFDGAVLERIAAVGCPKNRAAARKNPAHVIQLELVRFLRPDQAVEAIRDADDFPLVLQDGTFDRSANHGIEAGGIAATSADPDAADVGHCTVMVNALLVMPLSVAVTSVVAPEVAVESTAPLPLAMVEITAVLLLLQVTRVVMSCCCALPL